MARVTITGHRQSSCPGLFIRLALVMDIAMDIAMATAMVIGIIVAGEDGTDR